MTLGMAEGVASCSRSSGIQERRLAGGKTFTSALTYTLRLMT